MDLRRSTIGTFAVTPQIKCHTISRGINLSHTWAGHINKHNQAQEEWKKHQEKSLYIKFEVGEMYRKASVHTWLYFYLSEDVPQYIPQLLTLTVPTNPITLNLNQFHPQPHLWSLSVFTSLIEWIFCYLHYIASARAQEFLGMLRLALVSVAFLCQHIEYSMMRMTKT